MTLQKTILPIVIIALIAAALLCSGCVGRVPVPLPPEKSSPAPPPVRPAPLPEPESATETPAPSLPAYSPRTGPAKALYLNAEQALARGEREQAEMLIERALRIEPRNPHYWHTLARIKYAQGDSSQAIQLCRKSTSLAGGEPQLIELNNRLIQQAETQR
jgi:tetratricopeptide (TPR) repeat protein